MIENRNMIQAVVISIAILVGFEVFFASEGALVKIYGKVKQRTTFF